MTPTLDNPLAGLTVLVVEDNYQTARLLTILLGQYGAARTLMAGSVLQAMARLAEAPPDVALLDINLGTETVEPVAQWLADRRVPFVFYTGYADTQLLPPRYDSYPRLSKPCEPQTIAASLRGAVDAAGEGGR